MSGLATVCAKLNFELSVCRPHGFSPRRSPAEGVGEGIDGAVRCFCLAKHRSPDCGLCGVETALPIDRCQPVTMNSSSHTDTHTEAHTPTVSHLSKPGCGPWSCHTAGKRSPRMMCRRNAERGRNFNSLCTTVFSERQVKTFTFD